jgi:hypothetical protein
MGGSGNWLTIVGVRASTPLGSAASSRWVKKLKQYRELFPVEYFGRCTVIRCIERQNFGAGDHLGQLPERTLLSRHRKHARAIADRGFHNPPSDPSAAADRLSIEAFCPLGLGWSRRRTSRVKPAWRLKLIGP